MKNVYRIECCFRFGIDGENFIGVFEKVEYQEWGTLPLQTQLLNVVRGKYQSFLYSINCSCKIKGNRVTYFFPDLQKSTHLQVCEFYLEDAEHFNFDEECLACLNVEESNILVKVKDGEEWKIADIPIFLPEKPIWILAEPNLVEPKLKRAYITIRKPKFSNKQEVIYSRIGEILEENNKFVWNRVWHSNHSITYSTGLYFPKKGGEDEGLFVGKWEYAFIRNGTVTLGGEPLDQVNVDEYEGYREWEKWYYGGKR